MSNYVLTPYFDSVGMAAANPFSLWSGLSFSVCVLLF